MTLSGIIAFIFVIGTAILIHELGHFIVAGKFGILRHEFSIGMGPAIWKKRKGETLYTIRAIPIGGYVAMAGEDVEKDMVQVGQRIGIALNAQGLIEKIFLNPENQANMILGTVEKVDLYHDLTMTLTFDDGNNQSYKVYEKAMYIDMKTDKMQQIAPYDRCFDSKSKFARISTLVAGALMNFILAFLFVLLVGLRGEPTIANRVGVVLDGMPAQVAGLEAGDTIVEYNGFTITNAEELSSAIRSTTDEVSVTIIREGETHQMMMTPNVIERDGEMVPQIGIHFATDYHFSLGYAFRYAGSQFLAGFALIFMTFDMLFSGQAGVGDLSGPVGIAVMTAQVVEQGIIPLLIFASFINVNLGLINLLPLPAMDGGRILFILIEAIIGHPVNRKVEGYIHFAGFVLFMLLFVYIFFNDIFRIIG